MVQVPFIWLLGPTPFASALPFALIGSLAAPLAWAIGRDAGVRPSIAVGAVCFASFDALSFSIAAGLFFLLLGCVGAAWRLGRAQQPAGD